MNNILPQGWSDHARREFGKHQAEQERLARVAAAQNAVEIYGGVDGTGVYDDVQYSSDFQNSFVQQIFREWDSAARYYRRGPSTDGFSTKSLADKTYQEVYSAYSHKIGRTKRIFLAGYSRGGASVIRTCELLAKHNIPVDGLFLFDAVDRTNTLSADIIPDNVRICFHARRDPKSMSRTYSFGNCGTRFNAKKTAYREKFFFCTHGGMGGTPWTYADPDGVINEAEKTPLNNRLVDRVARATPWTLPTVIAHDTYRKASRTRITLEQDKIGSRQVQVWMLTALKTLRQELAKQAPVS